MRNAFASFIAIVALIACGRNTSLLVEEHETTSGQFEGFQIGMPMDRAFLNARNLGARLITAIPCQSFRVSAANIKELPPLAELEGVRITDFDRGYVDLYFSDRHVLRVVRSPKIPFVLPVNTGDDLAGTREKLLALLRTTSDLVVHPIVDREKQDTIALNESMPAGYVHECWRFELTDVKPAGAVFDLSFDQRGLTKIVYRRSRIRAE